MFKYIAVALCVLALSFSAEAYNFNCSYSTDDYTFDLSPLSGNYNVTEDLYTYYISVCTDVQTEHDCRSSQMMAPQVTQYWGDSSDECKVLASSLDEPAYSVIGAGLGVSAFVSGGTYSISCKENNSADLLFVCDPDVTGLPTIKFVASAQCVTTFAIVHARACPVA